MTIRFLKKIQQLYKNKISVALMIKIIECTFTAVLNFEPESLNVCNNCFHI